MKKTSALIVCLYSVFSINFTQADVTYTLHLEGVNSDIANTISNSMSEAAWYFNTYGKVTKHCNVYYSSSVPTAQANFDGVITFGGLRNTRVAMHEILHTLGAGTYYAFHNLMTDGTWDGPLANAQIQAWGDGNTLLGDSHIFWPYGLNYDREDSETNRQRSAIIATLVQCDMGINTNCAGEEPAGYTYAGLEGENICPVGTYDIAYGADKQFYYLFNQTGCTACTNDTFGDPNYGVFKHCYVKVLDN